MLETLLWRKKVYEPNWIYGQKSKVFVHLILHNDILGALSNERVSLGRKRKRGGGKREREKEQLVTYDPMSEALSHSLSTR